MLLKHKLIVLIIVLLVLIFGFFIQSDKFFKQSEYDLAKSEITILMQTLLPYYINGDLDAVYNMSVNFGYMSVEKIPQNARILHESVEEFMEFRIFAYEEYFGFSIGFLGNSVVFMKIFNDNLWNKYKIIILFLQLGTILLLSFFIFNQILKPLNNLHKAINELISGIYAKKLKINVNNEIGILFKSFNEMNEKISRMIKSRELITRNIAHELKTPLAKITLSLDLKEGDELKSDLKRYIYALKRISENMLEYDRIQGDNFVLKTQECLSESVLLEALKDFEGCKIAVNNIKSVKIECDFYLLTIAIKNLIENAIKYSDNGIVEITLNERGFMFCNSGAKLEHDISYYFEPFYRGEITQSGYGLGLPIIKEILNMHKMGIDYYYSNGKHIFYVRF